MSRTIVCLLLLVTAAPAFAEQPDPAFLGRAVAVLQAQRNQAMDAAAVADAKAAGLADELAKAKERIKEMEEKKAGLEK